MEIKEDVEIYIPVIDIVKTSFFGATIFANLVGISIQG